jgi:uncharacterized membrane protein
MVADQTAIIAILLLTAVTVATRLAGVWIMSYVAITPRIEAFLRYMATSVLIAIVVPITLHGTPRIWLAVGAAALVALLTRSAVGAMIAGAVVAAAGHAIGL